MQDKIYMHGEWYSFEYSMKQWNYEPATDWYISPSRNRIGIRHEWDPWVGISVGD